MTDHPTFSDDDLSLALDGEADAELLARIEADPTAAARLGAMRAAAARVAAPVDPLDDAVVDELVSTALDTPVAPERRATAGPRRATPWLVAASVIVLMAVGLSLVWAGRGTEQDQASAGRTAADSASQEASDGASESSFTEAGGAADASDEAEAAPSGGHGSANTVPTSPAAGLPVSFLGDYPSGAALREATATSFANALRSSDTTADYGLTDPDDTATSRERTTAAPAQAAVDRCAQQLQITLSLETNPIQAGYATVDGRDVLVYEFATTSVRDGSETTLVAAVGQDACDEVVLFER